VNISYKLGVLLGSILLVKLEFFFMLLLFVLGFWLDSIQEKNYGIIIKLIAISVSLILIVGHIKTTVAISSFLSDQQILIQMLFHQKI